VSGQVQTPAGDSYTFDTNVYVNGTHCRFYTLVIENAFSLRTWLPRQPAVRAIYAEYDIR